MRSPVVAEKVAHKPAKSPPQTLLKAALSDTDIGMAVVVAVVAVVAVVVSED